MTKSNSRCPFCHADTQSFGTVERIYKCGSSVVLATMIYRKNCSEKYKMAHYKTR